MGNMNDAIFEHLKEYLVELVEEYFPKGNRQRGKATVMMSRFLMEAVTMYTMAQKGVKHEKVQKSI